MMQGQLGYVDQETVDIAIALVDDLIQQHKNVS
jgi:hypothetical protein